jgi:hypothetical protein
VTAVVALARALDDLERAGQSWPCKGDALWISDRQRDRETAAELCQTCPVLALCGAAGDEIKADAAVWGGQPRGRAGYQPRKTNQKAS